MISLTKEIYALIHNMMVRGEIPQADYTVILVDDGPVPDDEPVYYGYDIVIRDFNEAFSPDWIESFSQGKPVVSNKYSTVFCQAMCRLQRLLWDYVDDVDFLGTVYLAPDYERELLTDLVLPPTVSE